ncbi:hypothetical protein G3444_15225 [Shewanella baltica]|uniref:hypothetical protein n=1 Tax=Shewanella baltica TaxID=62322 RepID=UPI00217EED4F|nr:hypothetical protein [Shewanella baltica]MCS6120239.1 hypothetical protein [Shewanella baltica]
MIAELTKTIPVIVGALIAMAGGLAGTTLTHIFSWRRERRKLIQDKAEKLIEALYEHRDWVARENSRLVFGLELPESPSPLDKAAAIQELYFPKAEPEFRKITASMKDITAYCYKQAHARISRNSEWISEFDGKEFHPMWQEYLLAFHSAVNKIVKLTKDETKT